MTNNNSASQEQEIPPEWRLPEMVAIEIQLVEHEARRSRNFESVLAQYNVAVEFIVKTEQPIPIRALSPVLYIGEEHVSEYDVLEADTYRFLGFQIDRFMPGAPISWGWIGDPQDERQETAFQFYL
ncbi:MAG: hypothetical protein R3293_11060 [Candidatus Promineifilaceae bacterium]|nr:hypothetical protein [Candidatus Promineifilaceae bacterium]